MGRKRPRIGGQLATLVFAAGRKPQIRYTDPLSGRLVKLSAAEIDAEAVQRAREFLAALRSGSVEVQDDEPAEAAA